MAGHSGQPESRTERADANRILTFNRPGKDVLCKQSGFGSAGQAQESHGWLAPATETITTELVAEQTPETPVFLVLATEL